jgi:hypothetical protein
MPASVERGIAARQGGDLITPAVVGHLLREDPIALCEDPIATP